MTARDGLYHSLNEEDGITARNRIKLNLRNKDVSSLYLPKKELDTTSVKLN